MSSVNQKACSTEGGGGGGAYVPPHKRAQHHATNNNNHEIPAKMSPPPVSPPPMSSSSEKAHFHRGRARGNQPAAAGGGGGGGGGSHTHSPTQNKNIHKKNHGKGRQSKSHSPTRSTNSNNSGNNNNSSNQRYHSPTRKEDLAIQKQQMKLVQDSLDRICCINLDRHPERWQSFQLHLHQSLGKKMGHTMAHHVERIPAIDGIPDQLTDVTTTWNATENAKWDRHIEPPMIKEMSGSDVGRALSHIKLWRELAAMPDPEEDGKRQANMLIMEDDALFYSPKLAMNKAAISGTSNAGKNNANHQQQHHDHHHLSIANHDFLTGFQLAWTLLPENWDIWYLGFSDRGDRLPVEDEFKLPKPKAHHHHHDHHHHHHHHYPSMSVQIFSPTYGFHTHGYVLTAKAARTLLDNLPVVGPLDVWLADNKWFGLKVYCSVVEGEGWQKTGAWLITQNRKKTCITSPDPSSQPSGPSAGAVEP